MEPTPDIEAMNAVAAGLRQRAATLATVSNRIDSQVAAMIYAGPAADQFRANAAERRQRLVRAIGELEVAADTVSRAAATAAAQPDPSGGWM